MVEGVDGADGLFETARDSLVAQAEASGQGVFEVMEGSPEVFLNHVAVAGFVGVGEGVARRGSGSAKTAEPRTMVAQGIADVVEAGGVGELCEELGDDVAPRREDEGLLVDAVLFGEAGGKLGRDQLAKLGEDGQFCCGWFTI